MLTPKEIYYGEKLLRNVRSNRSQDVSQDMFERGTLWRDNYLTRCNIYAIDMSLSFTSYTKFGSKRDFNDTTLDNLQRLKRLLNPIAKMELDFLNIITNADYYLHHATNSNKVLNSEGDICLYSRKNLQKKGIEFAYDNSPSTDVIGLADDDYVFFSLLCGSESKKKHSNLGNTFYKVPFNQPAFEFSSLSLFDIFAPTMHRVSRSNVLSNDSLLRLSKRSLTPRHTVIFNNYESSLAGLAMHTILTSRLLDIKERKKICSLRSDEEINEVIHAFFNPIIRVPKIFSARKGMFETYKGTYQL